ncbi:MAG: hypothetical protein ACXVDJ_08510 [Tumebacillaceae bacterium]
MNNHDRLLYLFDRLPSEQQNDLLNLMETWNAMPAISAKANESALNPALEETLGKEWLCLNALKKIVATHYPPRLELAYIAFHPLLDSVSTAKTAGAAEKMYNLEAAYELKRILEAEPESDIFPTEISDQLHEMLYQNDNESK